MSKGIIVRLDEGSHSELDTKLRDKGISKQFFFSKCVELFINGELAIDSSQVSNDSSNEVMELKKTIAIILERLDKLENDTKMIAFDTPITDTGLENNDSNKISNDSNEVSNDSNEVSNDECIDSEPEPEPEPELIPDKPKLAPEYSIDVNVPNEEIRAKNEPISKDVGNIKQKRKTKKIDLVRDYIETLDDGHIFPSQADLVEKTGIDKNKDGKYDTSFLSRGEGKAFMGQYFTKTDNGYILTKPE